MNDMKKIAFAVFVFTICIIANAIPNSGQSFTCYYNAENKDTSICSKDSTINNKQQPKLKDSKYKSFVKTKNRCLKCSCSGYWGYKHGNGTYEGNCSNTDAYGHKCGHGPEKHGLRKW